MMDGNNGSNMDMDVRMYVFDGGIVDVSAFMNEVMKLFLGRFTVAGRPSVPNSALSNWRRHSNAITAQRLEPVGSY